MGEDTRRAANYGPLRQVETPPCGGTGDASGVALTVSLIPASIVHVWSSCPGRGALPQAVAGRPSTSLRRPYMPSTIRSAATRTVSPSASE